MAPVVDPVESDTQLPDSADIVIIGGGIIGVSAAWNLARQGLSVVLCEKGHIGGEQSSRNWGYCRQQGRDPRELPLIIEAMRAWRGIEKEIEADVGFKQSGVIYLGKTKKDMASYEEWLEHARPYQIDSRVISQAEVQEHLPGISGQWAGALHTPSDGRAEPTKASPAIARAAQRLGAKIVTGCAVRGVETSGGRISAAVTEKGTIATQSIILAGGAWSRLFCGNTGIDLPQLKVLSSVMRTEPLSSTAESSVWGPGFAFRRRADGGYTIAHGGSTTADVVPDSFRLLRAFLPVMRTDWDKVRLRFGRRFFDELSTPRRWALDDHSPFEKVRVLDPEPHRPTLDKALTNLRRNYPQFADAKIAERWGGLIDVTPDAVPVISNVESLSGLTIATGFSGHGFGIGPGAGRLAADLATNATPVVDPAPFRFSRFAEGEGSRPMGHL
jgi:glycine/D-amino acid oxidase-like deaminating enzyme